MQLENDLKIARFWTRFAAFYLNLLILLVLCFLISQALIHFQYTDLKLWTYGFYILATKVFLGLLIFDSILQGISTVNITKLLLGLRLYDSKYKSSIGIIRSLLRSIFAFFSIAFLGLGYWAIAFNLDAKSMHDLLTSTRVVRVKQNIITKIITGLIQVLSIVAGLVITFALLMTLVFLPYTVTKSFYDLNKFATLDSKVLQRNLKQQVDLSISNNKISALVEANNIDYIEFELDDTEPQSYISKASLEKLGFNLVDYSYYMQELDVQQIKPSLVLPLLSFKDTNKQDLKIENQRFIVSEDRDQIGSDLLEIWDYKIDRDKSVLSLKLYAGDIEILANAVLSKESRDYLVYALRQVRLAWDEYLRFMPADKLKTFVKQKQILANEISFNLDTVNGYVDHISLEKPSKSEEFNKFCHDFFKQLDRFRLITDELKDKKSINLSLSLRYKEII